MDNNAAREAFEKWFDGHYRDKYTSWNEDIQRGASDGWLGGMIYGRAESAKEIDRLRRALEILSEGLEVFASCHPIVAARMRAKKLVWHPTGEEYTEIFEEAVHVPDYAQKILAKAEKE